MSSNEYRCSFHFVLSSCCQLNLGRSGIASIAGDAKCQSFWKREVFFLYAKSRLMEELEHRRGHEQSRKNTGRRVRRERINSSAVEHLIRGHWEYQWVRGGRTGHRRLDSGYKLKQDISKKKG